MTTDRKTILVIGATGAQGGAVASALLDRGTFNVRALTRKPASAAAQALAARGAEVVEGTLDDRATLRAAVKGCYGVFGVTNYWEHFERETEHGRNLINAVAGAEVEHFVFSSLPSVKTITNGALNVPHFEQKYELEQYARSLGIPSTFIHVAFYFDNFIGFFPPRKNEDGTYGFGFPQGDTPLAGVATEDIGPVVAAIFDRPAEFLGRTVGVVGDDLPPAEYAAALSRVTGKEVRYTPIPREVFASFGFPGAEDLADMFEFNRLHILERKNDLAESRSLNPAMQSFEQWATKHAQTLTNLLA